MKLRGHHGAELAEIERIYRERFGELERLAAAVGGAPDEAWDVVQDAFAGAVANRHRYRGDGPLEAWLWRAVLRTALNRRRKTRRQPAAVLMREAVASVTELREHDSALAEALRALSERQRSAVFLRYYADLDYSAIGRILGLRRGTVSALLHTAHRNLRRSISEVQV
jgi:RNA polymerase sigma factor (sigma-70 family)